MPEEIKSLSALYSEIDKKIDLHKNGPVSEITKNIRTKLALIKGIWTAYRDLSKIGHTYTAHESILHVEQVIIAGLKKAGIEINITTEPSLNKESLRGKGSLVFINHQGGGLETYISRNLIASISDKPCHWVLKDALIKIPFYGDALKAHEPIVIERDPNNFNREILNKYAQEIAEKLKIGHNVFMAFEGTRSKDGNLVTKHDKLASLFKSFIKQNIEESLFNQLLVTVDTFSTMPEPIEKKPFGKVRTKSSINVHVQELPHNTPLNTKKPNNIFEISENTLRKILNEKLEKISEEA